MMSFFLVLAIANTIEYRNTCDYNNNEDIRPMSAGAASRAFIRMLAYEKDPDNNKAFASGNPIYVPVRGEVFKAWSKTSIEKDRWISGNFDTILSEMEKYCAAQVVHSTRIRGRLPKIVSDTQNNNVISTLRSLGFEDRVVFVGLYHVDGAWYWSRDYYPTKKQLQQSEYANFKTSGDLDPGQTNKRVAAFDIGKRSWQAVTKVDAFVCEFAPRASQPTDGSLKLIVVPSEIGRHIPEHKYLARSLSSTGMGFDKPATLCDVDVDDKGEKGYPAAIYNARQQKLAHQSLQITSESECVLGAQDTAVEGKWRWVSGADARLLSGSPEQGELFFDNTVSATYHFSNWGSAEPNNSGDEDVLTMLASSGKWNDHNKFQCVICEYGGYAGDEMSSPYGYFENRLYDREIMPSVLPLLGGQGTWIRVEGSTSPATTTPKSVPISVSILEPTLLFAQSNDIVPVLKAAAAATDRFQIVIKYTAASDVLIKDVSAAIRNPQLAYQQVLPIRAVLGDAGEMNKNDLFTFEEMVALGFHTTVVPGESARATFQRKRHGTIFLISSTTKTAQPIVKFEITVEAHTIQKQENYTTLFYGYKTPPEAVTDTLQTLRRVYGTTLNFYGLRLKLFGAKSWDYLVLNSPSSDVASSVAITSSLEYALFRQLYNNKNDDKDNINKDSGDDSGIASSPVSILQLLSLFYYYTPNTDRAAIVWEVLFASPFPSATSFDDKDFEISGTDHALSEFLRYNDETDAFVQYFPLFGARVDSLASAQEFCSTKHFLNRVGVVVVPVSRSLHDTVLQAMLGTVIVGATRSKNTNQWHWISSNLTTTDAILSAPWILPKNDNTNHDDGNLITLTKKNAQYRVVATAEDVTGIACMFQGISQGKIPPIRQINRLELSAKKKKENGSLPQRQISLLLTMLCSTSIVIMTVFTH
eukprot:PhM_4_TR251/c1_g1_i1/m.105144